MVIPARVATAVREASMSAWSDAITVVNRMREPTTVYWHGMELESVCDGVAGWSRTGSRNAPLIGEAVEGGARTLAINGRREPPPVTLTAGETHRIRIININPDLTAGDAEFLVHFPFATEPGELLLRQLLRVR
jgi:hypothetical protein